MKEHGSHMDQLFVQAKNAPVEMDIAVVEQLVLTSAVPFSLKVFLLHHLNSIIIMTTTIGILTGGIILLWPGVSPPEQSNQEISPIKEDLTTETITFEEPRLSETFNIPIKAVEETINELEDDESAVMEALDNSNLVGTEIEEYKEDIAKVENDKTNEQATILEPNLTMQLKDVGQFNAVALAINIKVVLKKGDVCGIDTRGDTKLDLLSFKIKENTLVINVQDGKQKEFQKLIKGNTPTLDVYLPSIEGIINSSSGSIYSDDAIPSSSLDISLSGSGSIQLDKISPEAYEIAVSGSGNISLNGKGKAKKGSVAISGSGRIKVDQLETTDVSVAISGSGDVSVHALETLSAAIMGSGDICYRGDPKTSVNVSGSGRVSKCN